MFIRGGRILYMITYIVTEFHALIPLGLPQILAQRSKVTENPYSQGICVSFNHSFSCFDLQTLIQLYSVFVINKRLPIWLDK